MKCSIFACFVFITLALSAHAEMYEVKMLNRGEAGSMVFEPDYLEIQPGDSIKFIASQKSHNAASIDGMLPEGAKPFKGKINEELEVPFDVPGFYGIKCTPHYAMGMIMMVKVGNDVMLPPQYHDVSQPGLAHKRFDEIFKKVESNQK